MSYTLIISGTKPGFAPNPDLNVEAATREQNAFREQEVAEITQAAQVLITSLGGVGHTIREAYLDGEPLNLKAGA